MPSTSSRATAGGVGLPSSNLPTGTGNTMATLERANILRDQDEILDRMGESMGALKDMAGAITGELEEQATLLDETSLAVDVASGNMEAVTKRINKFIEASGGPKWCSVLTGLTIVLIILTWIAFT